MSTGHGPLPIVLGIVLAAVFAPLGIAKIAATASMRERAAHVGFGAGSYRLIGTAEVLGAVGVLVGLVAAPIGLAAGAGLLLLLVGAALAHLRAGDRLAQIAPAVLLGVVTSGYLLVLGGR